MVTGHLFKGAFSVSGSEKFLWSHERGQHTKFSEKTSESEIVFAFGFAQCKCSLRPEYWCYNILLILSFTISSGGHFISHGILEQKYFFISGISNVIFYNSHVFLLFLLEFRLALIQLAVGSNKSENLSRATKLISEAAKQGAKIVSLPVSWTFFGFDVFLN